MLSLLLKIIIINIDESFCQLDYFLSFLIGNLYLCKNIFKYLHYGIENVEMWILELFGQENVYLYLKHAKIAMPKIIINALCVDP